MLIRADHFYQINGSRFFLVLHSGWGDTVYFSGPLPCFAFK